MNTSTRNILTVSAMIAALIVTMIASAFILADMRIASASAPSGLMSRVATTSTIAVGPNVNTVPTSLFGTTQCSSRVISTASENIYLSFASVGSTTISVSGYPKLGFVQLASTTVAYDSGIYGCGLVSARAVATATITIMETN